jgi:hypothetical protein
MTFKTDSTTRRAIISGLAAAPLAAGAVAQGFNYSVTLSEAL